MRFKSLNLSDYTDSRDNNFNLLRFIAAFAVLFAHNFSLATGKSGQDPIARITGQYVAFYALDAFFVISGFLVTRSIVKRNDIRTFVLSRVLRIYPALIVVVFFCAFIVGPVFTNLSLIDYLCDLRTYKYFFINFTLVSVHIVDSLPGVFNDIPWRNSVNSSLWTLPWEVRMYATLAFLFYFTHLRFQILNRKQFARLIFFIAVASFLIRSYQVLYDKEFLEGTVNMFRFLALFFLGSSCYLYREKISLSPLMFSGMLFSLLVLLAWKKLFLLASTLLSPYIILFLAYYPAGRIRKFNQLPDYSYGIYIYSFVVQQSLVAAFDGISAWSLLVLSFLVSLLFAAFSWHFIEEKALRLKNSLSKSRQA